MNDKLSHLSTDEVEQLMNEYYHQGKGATELITKYRINASPGSLVGLFPNLINSNLFCPYCKNTNMETKRLSKSALKYSTQKPFCPNCKHSLENGCYCINCKQIRESEKLRVEKIKRRAIEEMADNEKICEVEIDDLTPKEILLLLSLVRHSLSEDLCFVRPFITKPFPLTPYFDFTREEVSSLHRRGFIAISGLSSLESCTFNEEMTRVKGYYPDKVVWEFLPGMDSEEKKYYIKSLEELAENENGMSRWGDEIPILWRLINKYEAIEYFLYQLGLRGFAPKIGDKTHTVIENLLEHHSIGQIFNLIWQAAKDVVDYAQRNKTIKPIAANMFIGSLQNRSDRAVANKWQIKCSRRDFDCPQSAMSSTFFDVILGIGESAIERKPPEKINAE
ncbi:MAG: hypothetical protein K0R25_1219 [Rickettsiaceae bacterium]|jgi:hypothetical protein|nr:hypothetical protein [Rickettsiaceae bacterium]